VYLAITSTSTSLKIGHYNLLSTILPLLFIKTLQVFKCFVSKELRNGLGLFKKFSLEITSSSSVIRVNLLHPYPSLSLYDLSLSLWFFFFHLRKLLFSVFLHFKRNFGRRCDWASFRISLAIYIKTPACTWLIFRFSTYRVLPKLSRVFPFSNSKVLTRRMSFSSPVWAPCKQLLNLPTPLGTLL